MHPTPDLLLRHARPGPRYTSYPTAPHWKDTLTDPERDLTLARIRSPASVYVHVPFCEDRCTYCALHMVATTRRDLGTRYLDALERHVQRLPFQQLDVVRIHLGGGTPTWLSPDELQRLFQILRTRFRPVQGAEISVEADPEVTTDAHLDTLASLGTNRISLGVQSFDPVVLAAVHRPQGADRVAALLQRARSHGMWGLNLDLMYGLPHQTPQRFADTLRQVLQMRPDRLAVFGYAHVPWAMPHQRRIPVEALPGPVERMALCLQAHRALTDAGYQAIGMDHFALPDDELAVAQRGGELHRNFMGYTTRAQTELIGLGPSAISETRDTYMQELPRLGRWYTAAESGNGVIGKACRLDADDQLRRDVIASIMCNFRVDWQTIGARHRLVPQEVLAPEIAALAPLQDDGLVQVEPDGVTVTPLGRWLVRNVAMCFDRYLSVGASPTRSGLGSPRYSQTV